MSDFATRFGYQMPKVELKETDMPDSLRSGLWDITKTSFFIPIAHYDIIDRYQGFVDEFDEISRDLWFHVFQRSADERGNAEQALAQLKTVFMSGHFYNVYEVIEFLCGNDGSDQGRDYAKLCNQILERELSQFRFADRTLIKVSSPDELTEIQGAMSDGTLGTVRSHIRRAAELYSDSRNPDYRNSIKESISAVEAAVAHVSGKKGGGVAKPLRAAGEAMGIHPALRDGFEKIYAYTSDAEGIRHALMDEKESGIEDAKFMLVACSAFSNYLLTKHAKLSD